MAFVVITDSISAAIVDQGARTVSCTVNGHWTGGAGSTRFRFGYDSGGGNAYTPWSGYSAQVNDSGFRNIDYPCDTSAMSYYFRTEDSGAGVVDGSTVTFKSYAVTAAATAPSISNILTTSATVDCNYYPNTNASTCSAQLQYKANSSGTWIDCGSANTTTGYTQVAMTSVSLTGLIAGTLYNTRLVITRDTSNDTSLTSSTTNFTTNAVALTLAAYTGDSELSVGQTSVIIKTANNVAAFRYDNTGTGGGIIYYRIKHDDNASFTSPAYTASASVAITGYIIGAPFTSNFTITGLSANTPYYYKLQFCSDDSTFIDATGSSGTFTTALNPTTPTAQFSVESTAMTSGTAIHLVHFIDSATNTPSQWAWAFGDGSTATESSPYKSYGTAGTYTVTQTVTNADGSDSEVKTSYITVLVGTPVIAFNANTTVGNRPLTVNFTDISSNNPTSWKWNVPDGQNLGFLSGKADYNKNPSHVYPLAGTYTVTLTASNYLGSSSASVTNFITVRPLPVGATFTAGPLSGPAPLAVQFYGTPSGDSTGALWSFGDTSTTTTTDNTPEHLYTTAGTYTVAYTVYGTTAGGGATVTSSSASRASYITVTADNTYKEMLEELRRQLLMNPDAQTVCADFAEWGGPSNILRYIYNRVCRIQLEAGPLRKTSTTIAEDVPGSIFLPSDLIEIRSIYANGVRLEKVDPRMADLNNQTWQTATSGDYTGWYVDPGDHLLLHFVPAITPSTFEVYYVYAPTEPTVPGTCSDTWELLPFPFVYWWILKFGVLADMLKHEGEMYDVERAKLCEKMFTEGVELIKLSLGDK